MMSYSLMSKTQFHTIQFLNQSCSKKLGPNIQYVVYNLFTAATIFWVSPRCWEFSCWIYLHHLYDVWIQETTSEVVKPGPNSTSQMLRDPKNYCCPQMHHRKTYNHIWLWFSFIGSRDIIYHTIGLRPWSPIPCYLFQATRALLWTSILL